MFCDFKQVRNIELVKAALAQRIGCAFLSDAQLDTLRKISCKFQLNPSSRLGVVIRTRFFDFDDLRTYLRTDGKKFCQVHN